jgi:hypothetical protein
MNRHANTLKAKAVTHTATQIDASTWDVISGKSGNTYRVTRNGNNFFCTCDWHVWHTGGECSHTILVRKLAAAANRTLVSAWGTSDDAARQHQIGRASCRERV